MARSVTSRRTRQAPTVHAGAWPNRFPSTCRVAGAAGLGRQAVVAASAEVAPPLVPRRRYCRADASEQRRRRRVAAPATLCASAALCASARRPAASAQVNPRMSARRLGAGGSAGLRDPACQDRRSAARPRANARSRPAKAPPALPARTDRAAGLGSAVIVARPFLRGVAPGRSSASAARLCCTAVEVPPPNVNFRVGDRAGYFPIVAQIG